MIVLERDKFPRFHIGESLLPFSMQTFTRLGLQEKLRAGFLEKFGGEIAEAGGEKAAKFYFKDGFGSRTDRSYQVTRSKFDKMLLDHAAESGAKVREETLVENVDFDRDGAQLSLRRTCVRVSSDMVKHVSPKTFGRAMSSTRAGGTLSLEISLS